MRLSIVTITFVLICPVTVYHPELTNDETFYLFLIVMTLRCLFKRGAAKVIFRLNGMSQIDTEMFILPVSMYFCILQQCNAMCMIGTSKNPTTLIK